MNIEFDKIVTNALSALVATVFIGAAAIVWKQATSIDQKIEEAKGSIRGQQVKLEATQTTVVEEIAELRNRIKSLESQAMSVTKVLSETERTKDRVKYEIDKPFILKEFKNPVTPEDLKKEEINRIKGEIDVRQQQMLPRTGD